MAVLLLHYLCLYLDLFVSLSLAVSRADRQIYLHRWRGRDEIISPACPASGLWQAGLWGNPGCVAPPQAGHIPLCCPRAGSQFSAWWDQSLSRLTQSQISLSERAGQQKTGSAATLHTGCFPQRFHKASDLFFLTPHFFLSHWWGRLLCLISIQRRPGGSKCVPHLEWPYLASLKHWTCTINIMTLLGSEHSILIRSKFRSGKSDNHSVCAIVFPFSCVYCPEPHKPEYLSPFGI